MKYTLIIPAAGQGKRMGAGKNKLFLEMDGKPVIVHTLQQFDMDEQCEKVVLVINMEEKEIFQMYLSTYGIKKHVEYIPGGQERQESVYNGVKHLQDAEYVVVHDGARPFVEKEVTHRVVGASMLTGAAICAVPVKDTIKRVVNEVVQDTVERSSLWSVQTPQAFRLSLLKKAHEYAIREAFVGTDDASLVERLGDKVQVVMGDYYNIKVTTPEDLLISESFLKRK
ncbi:2-C-methyl-D-erythritol 4-phosphate cytidylyltransferase [Priestia taiwanensis]|uniref:2-C-methyl-D-erythritol 4-phosphate cytidylyltransferase n=1 Tax=Priestia taiwanensis TaxID=1347902 RepID=A0A917EU44_9BACI|nr:2-C-methyl-D-erythritol 4-phosphate cytidylyltransferase [Priestia taiwanensis]MBM7365142.1 2-C-methyl-D-erythritol 4-phosphate cytidylyltransferase [Priestia taiwanensis]GGE83956.1 2-C-methyl-D-erythritol 4-phosphate cytidylyltransferase [Priestia taiwanensis]